MLNNADLTFPVIKNDQGEDVELTHGRYIGFLESKDRSVREAAFKGMYDTYGKFINTFASTLIGDVKKNNFMRKSVSMVLHGRKRWIIIIFPRKYMIIW